MIRRVSDIGVQKIAGWEGCRLEAYQDIAGKWTVGFGHTLNAEPGMVITQARAVDLLLQDLEPCEQVVSTKVQVPLAQHQFDALCSFVFNVGVRAFENSTLLKKLNAGKFDEVPSELMRWTKITDPKTNAKVTSVGLANRRAAEIGLWARGSHVSSAAPDVAARGSTVVGAVKSGTGGGAVAVASTVAAAGGILQAAAPHIELLEDLLYKAPTVLAIVAVIALVGVIIWRVKRD